jgi:tRNA threonylcarbamoyladenosine biosynthesis protein TsaB
MVTVRTPLKLRTDCDPAILCQFAYTAWVQFIVLDTADARGSVALFGDNGVVCAESHLNDEDYSSWLLPSVHRVLGSSELSLADLEGYAVCAGPGSFTGLRIGLTTVKAWSEIYHKPIAAISRLEALAVDLPGEPAVPGPFVAALIDARRGQLFAALYEKSGERFQLLGEESVIPPTAFLKRVANECKGRQVHWRTPDPALVQAMPEWQAFPRGGDILERVGTPFADRLGWVALRKFRLGELTDAISLDANYVRRSDAELYWKGTKSALTR